jgi:Deoxyribonuclease NucA/NucB
MIGKYLPLALCGLLASGVACYATTGANGIHNTQPTTQANLIARQIPAIAPVVEFSASRMPNISAHIQRAQASGKYSATLKRITDKTSIAANRRAACGSFKGTGSCDEYPFASTAQGGAGASVAGVPLAEQRIQGGTLSSFYQKNNIGEGGAFQVKVVP